MRSRLAALALMTAAYATGCTKIVNTDDLEPLASAEGFCYAAGTEYTRIFAQCVGFHSSAEGWLFAVQTAGGLGPPGNCAGIANSAAAGRQRYDRNVAQLCLDQIGSISCNTGSLDACSRVLTGAVGPGGACQSYADCDPVATRGCNFGAGVCPGTCTPPATLGNPCGPGCAAGLACDGTNCVVAPPQGQPCMNGTCAANLVCNTSNTCEPPGHTGDPCSYNGQCDVNFFCDTYLVPATCQPLPVPPVSGLGGRCGGPLVCQAGLRCDFPPTGLPTCQPKFVAGAGCSYGDDCAEGLSCVALGGAPATCQPQQRVGVSCVAGNQDCQSGLVCDGLALGDAGKCVPLAGLGEWCGNARYESRTCGEGWCDTATTSTCTAFLALGASCTDSGQCSLFGTTASCNSMLKCAAACF